MVLNAAVLASRSITTELEKAKTSSTLEFTASEGKKPVAIEIAVVEMESRILDEYLQLCVLAPGLLGSYSDKYQVCDRFTFRCLRGKDCLYVLMKIASMSRVSYGLLRITVVSRVR